MAFRRLVCVSLALAFWQSAARAEDASAEPRPPIPVKFSIKEAGFVTLVIEDAQGHRVRNLVGDTFFDAGDHTLWWDGLDESGVVRGTPNWTYKITGKMVTPGTYRVRGLAHKQIDLRYEMTVNCPGNPPWEIEDRTGAWLADHTPQTSCLFMPAGSPYGKQPQVLLGSSTAEAGHSLAWVDLEGNKLYGSKAAGWQGAHALARDLGKNPRTDVSAYTAFCEGNVQIITLHNDGKTSPVFAYEPRESAEKNAKPLAYKREDKNRMGLAVYDGVCVVSLPPESKLLFVNAKRKNGKNPALGELIGFADVPAPAGLMVDAAGKLYVVAGKEVRTFDVDWAAGKLRNEKTLIGTQAGLEDPHKLAMDDKGGLYVSDWGNSNTVKLFAADGRLIRAIGKPGPLQVGPYDPNGMTQPNGIAITPAEKQGDGHLWVAECSYLPKRCSIWSLDGKLVKDFIGPSPYAGGGILDPRDKTRFYFSPHSGCLEFKLDWEKGTYQLKNVLFRPSSGRLEILDKDNVWQTPHLPIYVDDRQYMANIYNENDGPGTLGIWQVRNGIATVVAAVGNIRTWSLVDELVLKDNWLQGHLPDGVKLNLLDMQGKKIPLFNRTLDGGKVERVNLMFAWSDLNNNEKVELDELTFAWAPHLAGGLVAGDGLTVTGAQGVQLEVQRFTDAGVPVYDCTKVKRLLKNKLDIAIVTRQPVVGRDGWLVVTGGPIEGYRNGELMWTYPSQWPTGMSKGASPKPQYPGQLLNTMELLGPTVTPRDSDAGEIWAINGDYGTVYLLTTDGLFVSTLFKDTRLAASPYWPTPAKRGLLLNDYTLLAECYFPTIMQTTDGKVYLQAGKNRSSIVRVDGLETVRRLPAIDLQVTKEMLEQAKAYFLAREQQRPRAEGDDTLTVLLADKDLPPPAVDGKLDEWAGAYWAQVDDKTRAALMVAGDKLYAAFSTEYDFPLACNPDSLQTIFKGGESLDLMLGVDAKADPQRKALVSGDLRLTVSRINKKAAAVLSRPVVPGTQNPVKYESPIGSVVVDRVDEVTAQVELAGQQREERRGTYDIRRYNEFEFAIPLSALGLKPDEALTLSGDIGILRGKPGLTSDRVYWHNKATGQTADLPTEARLTPNLWGKVKFAARPAPPPAKPPRGNRR